MGICLCPLAGDRLLPDSAHPHKNTDRRNSTSVWKNEDVLLRFAPSGHRERLGRLVGSGTGKNWEGSAVEKESCKPPASEYERGLAILTFFRGTKQSQRAPRRNRQFR
jgi:hypothetical protein